MIQKIQPKECEININLFRNWYIGSNKYEYFVYKLKKGKEGDYKDKIGHYSTIESLLDHLPDVYLKNESNAKTIEELKEDIQYIKSIIENFV